MHGAEHKYGINRAGDATGFDKDSTMSGAARQTGDGGIATASALSDVLGATTDAAVTTDANGTLSGKLRGVVSLLVTVAGRLVDGGSSIAELLTTIAGRLISTGEIPATVANSAASLNSKITTCNTTAVAGTVTADAGTNLNTSALALEATQYPTYGTSVVLAISGTSAATGSALSAGKYLLCSEVTCAWIQAASPTAVLATDHLLPAGQLVPVTLAAQKLAAITAGASGNLYIMPIS